MATLNWCHQRLRHKMPQKTFVALPVLEVVAVLPVWAVLEVVTGIHLKSLY